MESRSPAAAEKALLDQLRRRRAELLESMRAVEQALSAPAPGREAQWAVRVHVALVELEADFRVHVDVTEGPHGLYGELLVTAPRLAGAVARLTRDHALIKGQIDDLLARAGALAPARKSISFANSQLRFSPICSAIDSTGRT